MTKEELAEIRERVELTPGGEWSWDSRGLKSGETSAHLIWATGDISRNHFIGLMEEVAEFVPCARADILRLLAEVERLQEEQEKNLSVLGSIMTQLEFHYDTIG